MNTSLVRVSEKTYEALRAEAYRQHKKMKTVIDEIMEGKIDPTKIEII